MTQRDPEAVSTEPKTERGSGWPRGQLRVLMKRPAHVAGAGATLVLCLLVAAAAFGGVSTSGRSGAVGLAATNSFARTGQLTGVDVSLDRVGRPAEPVPSGTSEDDEGGKGVLAFHRDQMIWVSDADGTNARQMTPAKQELSRYLPSDWLADGRLVGVFSDSDIAPSGHFETVSLEGARSEFVRAHLAEGDSRAWATSAAVAPDATKVVTVHDHSRECGGCWYRSSVRITPLPYQGGESGDEVTISDVEEQAVCDVGFGGESDSVYLLVGGDDWEACGEASDQRRIIKIVLDRSGNASSQRTVIEGDGISAFSPGPDGEIALARDGHVFARSPGGPEDDLGEGVDVEFSTDGSALYVTRGEIGGDQSIWLVPRDDPDSARLILENASNPVVGTVAKTASPEAPEEPPALILGIDRLAGVPFGLDGDTAVSRLVGALNGTVMSDEESHTDGFWPCHGPNGARVSALRSVEIQVGDSTVHPYIANGVYMGYTVTGSDPRFQTDEGAGLGSTESDLLRIYGDRIDLGEGLAEDEWMGWVGDDWTANIVFTYVKDGPVTSVLAGGRCSD